MVAETAFDWQSMRNFSIYFCMPEREHATANGLYFVVALRRVDSIHYYNYSPRNICPTDSCTYYKYSPRNICPTRLMLCILLQVFPSQYLPHVTLLQILPSRQLYHVTHTLVHKVLTCATCLVWHNSPGAPIISHLVPSDIIIPWSYPHISSQAT